MSPRWRRRLLAAAALGGIAYLVGRPGQFPEAEGPTTATPPLAAASAAAPSPVAASATTMLADAADHAASTASQPAIPASAASASDRASAALAAKPASAVLAANAASAASTAGLAARPASAGVVVTASAASAASAPQQASAASAAASAAHLAAMDIKPCVELVRLPNLSKELCEAGDLKLSGAYSVEGFPLYQRDVVARPPAGGPANGQLALRRPRVLVIGAMHGDEISSTSLVFHWIAHAMETGADMDWRFIPALNPDGLLQKKPTRTNARGVDLNRNFPTPNWDQEALQYWAKRTKQDARRYPGPSALSEPESRFIQQTMDRWRPDVVVSVHAPFGVLDYDGPSTPPQRLGRLFLDRVGIYPGSLGNYGGVHRGVPVVTIELPSAFETPTDTEMRQMWIDLLRWIGERLPPAER